MERMEAEREFGRRKSGMGRGGEGSRWERGRPLEQRRRRGATGDRVAR